MPFSITNKSVDRKLAEDRTNPFSLLEFIRVVGNFVEFSEITKYYNQYLIDWNTITTNSEANTNLLIVEAYRSFIRDISLNFNSEAENKFFSQINYNDPYDLDVALSFIGRKIKEIALYYGKKRENIKLEATKHKLTGSTKGIVAAIKEKILDVLANNSDRTQYSTVADAAKNISIHVDELYQNTAGALNKTPNSLDYDAKDRDYGLDIFLKSNQELVDQIFGSTSAEYKQANEVDSIFDNKRGLTKKYMGADYYYLSSTEIEVDSPDIVVNTPFKITYNKQQVINQLIDVTPPPTCECIIAKGPVSLIYTKCGDINPTSVIVPVGQTYTACGFEVSSTNLTAVTVKGSCTTQADCIPTPPPPPSLVYYCNYALGRCLKATRSGPDFFLTLEDCQANCSSGGSGLSGGGGGTPGGGGGGPSTVNPNDGAVCDCDDVDITITEGPSVTWDTVTVREGNITYKCATDIIIKLTLRVFIGFDCFSFSNPIVADSAELADGDTVKHGDSASGPGVVSLANGFTGSGNDIKTPPGVAPPADQNRPNDIPLELRVPCEEFSSRGDSYPYKIVVRWTDKKGTSYECPKIIDIPVGNGKPDKCCVPKFVNDEYYETGTPDEEGEEEEYEFDDLDESDEDEDESDEDESESDESDESDEGEDETDCPSCNEESDPETEAPPGDPDDDEKEDCSECPEGTDNRGIKGKNNKTNVSNTSSNWTGSSADTIAVNTITEELTSSPSESLPTIA